MDPVKGTFLGLPGWGVLWIITLIAFGVFGWRIFQLISLLRKARPENRFDQLGKRIQLVIRNVLLQVRIFNEKSIGLPHFLIFWGFVVYASCFNWSLIRGLLPFLPVPYPDEIGVTALFLDLFSLLVVVSLVAAIVRRLFYPPPHLHLSMDANLILMLIGLLMLTTTFGFAFRIQAGEMHASAWTPISKIVAGAFSTMPKETAINLAMALWWAHMLIVLFFLVYLPYSKHLHLLASPFNVFFGNLKPVGDLGLAGAPEEASAGASKWEELTWKQVFGGFSCAECGRCDRSCPATASGYPLQPQQIIQKVKKHVLKTGLSKSHNGNGNGHEKLIGEAITEAELWACTTCMACMERCAVLNEQIPLIVQMRRHLVGQGSIDRTVQDMLANVTRYGNSFGKSDRMRAKWTQPLGWKIKDARKEPVEYLWYVGDYASYDPRLEDITRKTAQIFKEAGLDFGLLYEGERNAGNDIRRLGEEGLFDMLREKNLTAMAKAKFKTIVTTDPHTYNTLKNEYRFEGEPVAVVHYTELLSQLIKEGKIVIKKKLAEKVCYHDPCYLGRYNGIYDPPRDVLAALGVELVEMSRNRNCSFCCGAGGGRIWMEDTPGIKERPSENRIREMAKTEDVTTLVVACPKDIAMFRDAVKTTGNEGKINVKDLSELVWDAMKE